MTYGREGHPLERLSAFVDGDLPGDERERIQEHLDHCAPCRTLAQDFRLLAAGARQEEAPPVPAELQSRIRRRLDRGETRPTKLRRWVVASRMAGLAAAAAVVVTVGLWSRRVERPVSSEPAAPSSGPAAPLRVPAPDFAPVPPPPVGGTGREGRAPRPVARPDTSDRLRQDIGKEAMGGKDERSRPQSVPSGPGVAVRETAAPEPDAASSKAEAMSAASEPGLKEAGAPAAQAPEMRNALQAEGVRAAKKAFSGRTLRLDYASCRITIADDGTLVVRSEGYSCSARPGKPVVEAAVDPLFALAAGPTTAGSGEGAPPEGRPGPVVALRDAGPVAGAAEERFLGAAVSAQIDAGVRALMRSTYRPLLEERCGPLPEALRGF